MDANTTTTKPTTHTCFAWTTEELVALLKADASAKGHAVPHGRDVLLGLEHDYFRAGPEVLKLRIDT